MALALELNSANESLAQTLPADAFSTINAAKDRIISTFDRTAAIKPGSPLPPFSLPNAVGKTVTSTSLLSQGPLLITFYRGEWCPFCNLALQALQKRLGEFQERGAQLVAVSPELPDRSLATVEKHALKFEVLSDVGNGYARRLGLAFEQDEALRPVFDGFGFDLRGRHGNDDFVVPVPASILVDREGVVRNVFVEPDHTKRLEPEEALAWIDALG